MVAGLKAGKGALSKVVNPAVDTVPKLREISDGVSKTIFFAESAGRPFIYQQGKKVVSNLDTNHVNGGGLGSTS